MTELDCARKIIAAATHPTIVELGAHHGIDTVRLYDEAGGIGCRYIAVEADPLNLPALLRTIEGRRIDVVWAAVWDFCGELEFYQSTGNHGASSSAREPKAHTIYFPDIKFERTIKVPSLTLNHIAQEYGLGDIDLIWCDIQGAERNMVQGGNLALARTRWLLTECDKVELYAGQATRDELLAMLPDWELIKEWPANANMLLRNRNVK